MKWQAIITVIVVLLHAGIGVAQRQPQGPRRSQRVRMEQVQVVSPDGNVRFTILPNAERLTFTVTLGAATTRRTPPPWSWKTRRCTVATASRSR